MRRSTTSSYRLPPSALILRILLFGISVGLLSAPITLPWDVPAPYIRWFKYTIAGEALWRGTFSCFVIGNLLSVVDPIGTSSDYVTFFSTQCLIHGSAMLVMNLLDLDGNGGIGHLITEIPGFITLGIVLKLLLWHASKSRDLSHLEKRGVSIAAVVHADLQMDHS